MLLIQMTSKFMCKKIMLEELLRLIRLYNEKNEKESSPFIQGYLDALADLKSWVEMEYENKISLANKKS